VGASPQADISGSMVAEKSTVGLRAKRFVVIVGGAEG
jgi:hypothetical protein